MVKQVILTSFYLFVIASQLQTATTENLGKTNKTEEKGDIQHNVQQTGNTATRIGRIMRVLKDPIPPIKRNHAPQPPQLQFRQNRYPPNQQRPQSTNPYRPFFSNTRKQILRRVQNGPSVNTVLRPQQTFNYDPAKVGRIAQGLKDTNSPLNFGKSTVYRPHFLSGPHPNALTQQVQSQQYLQNFKASPQYNGNAIVRPLQEIQQFPLPQQHPQHQPPLINERPSGNTAPQIFPLANHQFQPLNQQTEAFIKATGNVAAGALPTYSVYEDPEISEHAPLQYNSQQNPLTYNMKIPKKQVPPAVEEAENYLKFMSTNEYFLPKFNPNYKKLDEENDLRFYKQPKNKPQQYQTLQPFGKMMPTNDVASAASFQTPIQVSQLFYHEDPLPASTIVRGSYQTGNNAFVVKSDGNKAIKHIVPTSTQETIAPSNLRFNSQRQRTPEPLRFEFTERDAVHAAHTKSPYSHLQHPNIGSGNISPVYFAASSTPAYEINQNRPIAVNEVDTDPEDGDDMQEAGTDFFGRVPIRSSTEIPQVDGNAKPASSTPATQQTDTEEYCEHMCANVQDDDAEIICGADGYMYTGEAQMECYASCLHIDVTIQGKGSCSAR